MFVYLSAARKASRWEWTALTTSLCEVSEMYRNTLVLSLSLAWVCRRTFVFVCVAFYSLSCSIFCNHFASLVFFSLISNFHCRPTFLSTCISLRDWIISIFLLRTPTAVPMTTCVPTSSSYTRTCQDSRSWFYRKSMITDGHVSWIPGVTSLCHLLDLSAEARYTGLQSPRHQREKVF